MLASAPLAIAGLRIIFGHYIATNADHGGRNQHRMHRCDLETTFVSTSVLLQLEKNGFNATAPISDELMAGKHRVTRDKRPMVVITAG